MTREHQRIVIGGASGFLGTALVERFREAGHELVRLVRREPAGPGEVTWRPGVQPLDPAVVEGADAAINLAGAGVSDRRWDEAYKALIRSSRVDSTRTLATAIAGADTPPRVLLNASAIGFYGDTGDAEVDESAPAGDGYLAEVSRDWEAATASAEQAGVQVVHLRIGLVLGPGGGLLKPMVRIFRYGLGGRLGTGQQWMSWISQADVVSAIEFLLNLDSGVDLDSGLDSGVTGPVNLAGPVKLTGPVNLTGPAPVRNADFTRTLGQVLHRPAIIPVPGFALRLVLGEFGAEVLSGQRVRPAVLTGAGYRFQHPTLESALRWSLS